MSSYSWPPFGSPSWKDPVANAASLPAIGNTDGDARVVLDTDSIYVWDEGTSAWLAVASPSGAAAIDGLNGDVSASGPGVVMATLATVNSNVGSFTNANITVNGKGLITAASNGTAGANTSLSNLSSVAINTDIDPDNSGSINIGANIPFNTIRAFSGRFGATGISFNNGVWTQKASITYDLGLNLLNIVSVGDIKFSGNSIDVNSTQIHNVVDPTSAQDAATKAYADTKQASGNYITALTGDVTASGPGSVSATIANNAVTNAKAAQMAASTIKGNNSVSTANASDLSVSQVNTLLGLYPQIVPSSCQIVWVMKGGNDTTGTGTYDNPYLTYTKAISTITDNAASKRYVIMIGGGTFSESVIALKPFVSLVGLSRSTSRMQVTGAGTAVTLDSSWSGVSSARATIENITFTATGFNMDFQALGAGGSAVIETHYLSIANNFVWKGRAASENLDMDDTIVFGTTTIQVGTIDIESSELVGAVAINTTTSLSAAGVDTAIYGGTRVLGLVTLTVSGGQTNTLRLDTSMLEGGISATGATVTVTSDVSSLPRSALNTFASGATLTLVSDSPYLRYTPTTSSDWASVPTTAQGALDNLAGITKDVSARAHGSTTTISGTLATIVYATEDFDPANAYNNSTGVYTAVAAGKIQVNAGLLITGTFALNDTLIMEIQKNGSVYSRSTVYLPAVLTDELINISDIVGVAATDTIQIKVSCSSTTPSIVSSNFDNFVSFARIA